MASKRLSNNRAAEPPRVDDLKLINGIGPAVEKRLNGVGIFTFARLADLSPADIAAAVADLTGLSAERIIKQDWIGQARKLAVESISSEAQKNIEPAVEPTASAEHTKAAKPLEEPQQARKLAAESTSSKAQQVVEAPAQVSLEHTHASTPLEEPQQGTAPSLAGYHPATFVVELLLDENNNVQSTHVMHVQSRHEHTWSDWPKAEILDFLDQSIGVNISSSEPVLANAKEPEQVPALVTESKLPTSVVAKPGLAGTLQLCDMMIIGSKSAEPRAILPHDQPFDVRLTLDLTEMTLSGNTALNYKASIYGKNLGSRSGQVVGEAEGTIKPADTVTINVKGNPLPEGIFQLTAKVMLAPPHTKPIVRPGTTAVIARGPVQVY